MNRYSDRPDIMGIGDSMYQGIRSLSFLPSMVQHSTPKQVADALGMAMVVPDLQRPMLFDLEQQIREGGLLHLVQGIRNTCLQELPHWPLNQPWSQHEAFDNIAVGGATIGSMLDDTDANHRDEFIRMSATLATPGLSIRQLASTVGSLWFALNNCYTLNPRHRDEQAGKSQMQQVEDRLPRILLINIGSNEGLFKAGFLGDFSQQTMAGVDTIPRLLAPLAERLKALPARVERIVFNGLIRPRFIPNLMPSAEHQNDFPGEANFFAYGPRISDTQTRISAQQVQDFDALVARVNAEAQDVLRTALGDRVRFADVFAACPPFDGKHFQHRGLAIPRHNKTLTNQALQPLPFNFIGGFAGLDNMHPTVPGYAVIADVVLAALGRSVSIDKDAAYDADTLLNHLPGLRMLVFDAELALVGSLGVFRKGEVAATV
ncbi:MAG TPA: hypothetical protein VL614_21875 [Acetobacteraceae bacterium]|nr:hypothetical protein [Acetobacteraceae bacterium]